MVVVSGEFAASSRMSTPAPGGYPSLCCLNIAGHTSKYLGADFSCCGSEKGSLTIVGWNTSLDGLDTIFTIWTRSGTSCGALAGHKLYASNVPTAEFSYKRPFSRTHQLRILIGRRPYHCPRFDRYNHAARLVSAR